VDDDDGNLTNGTPHSMALYAAFNRHGIACTSDVGANTNFRGCTQPAPPTTLSLDAGTNNVWLDWSDSSEIYDVYRNEQGCNEGGFVKVINDFPYSFFPDNKVANDFAYYYQVIAQPNGNEACASEPSPCLAAAPCLRPQWITNLATTAVSSHQVDLSWTASLDATRYHIYRFTFPDGPSIRVGTQSDTSFSDTSPSSCTSYYFSVRAAKNETCESYDSNSNSVFVTTSGSSCPFTVVAQTVGGGEGEVEGTITSSPAGINCGADCREEYPFNTQVTLTATPTEGFFFYGWSDSCTGRGTCVMTQPGRVSALFSRSPVLIVSLRGPGTVTSVPGGINCTDADGPGSTNCNESYPLNTQVTLTATPAAGYVFYGWIGACPGTAACTVTMTEQRTVAASFIRQPQELTVRLAGAGEGTVYMPPGIYTCGADCRAYNYNDTITLTATPAVGSVFTGWSGDCTGTETCSVTMTQAHFVTATFSVMTYTLIVDLAGAGSGTVTSMPAGIHCWAECIEEYDYNTLVTLAATPDAGSLFTGWSGDCAGATTCAVSMTEFRLAVANFSIVTDQDFYTVNPCRVLDTRVSGTTLTSEVPLIVNIAGTCGVPLTAKAVSLNLTAVMASGQGFITLYPGDITSPGTWTISFPPFLNRANNAVIPLAWNGSGTLAALAAISSGGTVDMILDVTGYYE
jgi:hypothetical protein